MNSVDGVINGKPTEGSNAQTIDVVFESRTQSPSIGTQNGEYLTHPAFTNFDVEGIWVGKYETGYKGASTKVGAQVNEENSSKVIIKPNSYSWRNISISNAFKSSYNYERTLDSHMMKNTEWGAVAYLSHSNYGINKEARVNNNSDNLTGYASVNEPTCYTGQSESCNYYDTNPEHTKPYNTEVGYLASTTGNITGVYDMSGGAWEYVAGYANESLGESGFTLEELETYKKYFDVYTEVNEVYKYSNRILGDATGELGPFYRYKDGNDINHPHNNWYDDHSEIISSSERPWFIRGGAYPYGVLNSQFYFRDVIGKQDISGTFRIVLSI